MAPRDYHIKARATKVFGFSFLSNVSEVFHDSSEVHRNTSSLFAAVLPKALVSIDVTLLHAALLLSPLPSTLLNSIATMVKVDLGGLLGGKPLLEVLDSEIDGTTTEKRVTIRRSGPKNMHFSWHNTISLPRLVVTSDTDDFDTIILQHFKEEGFQVAYLPYTGDKKDYKNKLQHLADPLELGDKYAIVGM